MHSTASKKIVTFFNLLRICSRIFFSDFPSNFACSCCEMIAFIKALVWFEDPVLTAVEISLTLI